MEACGIKVKINTPNKTHDCFHNANRLLTQGKLSPPRIIINFCLFNQTSNKELITQWSVQCLTPYRGVNPGGVGGSRPPDFGQGGCGGGSWTGREILLYLIMYRKCVESDEF